MRISQPLGFQLIEMLIGYYNTERAQKQIAFVKNHFRAMSEQMCNVNQNSARVESLALVWQNELIVFTVSSS